MATEETRRFLFATRDELYSEDAVDRFCVEAQKIVGGTTVEAEIVLWNGDPEGFTASNALPYQETGEDLPFTVQQYTNSETDPVEYPKVISCKMKGNDDIIALGVDDSAGPGASCKEVIETVVEAVKATLTTTESEQAAENNIGAVVVQGDNAQFFGSQWVNPLPPEVACAQQGTLYLQGKSLPVPRSSPLQFLLPNEWLGVQYCHLPAPEYVRNLMTGQVQAPAGPEDLLSWILCTLLGWVLRPLFGGCECVV